MSKFFTTAELRLCQVPTVRNFTEFLPVINDDLGNDNVFVGAILCGSVLSDLHTLRSDIDITAVCRDDCFFEAALVLQGLYLKASRLSLTLDIHLFTESDIRNGEHKITVHFASQLKYAVSLGGLIGVNFLGYIKFDITDLVETANSFFVHKKDKLASGLLKIRVMSEADLCALHGKSADLPLHICRYILRINGHDPNQLNKQSICETYGRLTTDKLRGLLGELIAAEKRYQNVFEEALRTKKYAQYAQYLNELRAGEMVKLAISFARENLLFLSNQGVA